MKNVTKNTNICKFCGEEKALIDAHIIPKAFCKQLFDGAEKMVYVSNHIEGVDTSWQKGFYDPEILCKECDGAIGKYDDYAIKFLRDYPSKYWKKTFDDETLDNYYRVEFYNYTDLKLFFISVIWRMSITKHPFYKNVRLGPYENIAFQMLKSKMPGEQSDFATVICKLKPAETASRSTKNIHLMHLTPGFYKNDIHNGTHYKLAFGGYVICIKVDNKSLPDRLKKRYLAPNQPLTVIEVPYEESWLYKQILHLQKMKKIGAL